MKHLFFNLFLTIPLFVNAADRALICDSTISEERVRFTAYVKSSTLLTKAQVKGVYDSDIRNLRADNKYQPRNRRYMNFNRFGVLEDTSCWFTPLFPKSLSSTLTTQKFTAYIQIFCEGGGRQTVTLACFIK